MKFDQALDLILRTMAERGDKNLTHRVKGKGEIHIRCSVSDAVCNGRRWSKADEQLLASIAATSTAEECAERLRRSIGGVCVRASWLGLKFRPQRGMTEEAKQYIIQHSATMPVKQIAAHLGYTKDPIYTFIRANKLPLPRPKWDDARYAEVTRLLMGGMSRKMVCRTVGVEMADLNHHLYRKFDKFVGLQLRRKKK